MPVRWSSCVVGPWDPEKQYDVTWPPTTQLRLMTHGFPGVVAVSV
jgi:hypothetical protein